MFRDAERALTWAFNTIERPIIKTPAINHMRQNRDPQESTQVIDGLPNQYRHAQAAQIIGMVEGLRDKAAVEYLKARFGRRVDAYDLRLVVYTGCDTLGVGLDKAEAVYKIMRGYFCNAMTIRQIARMLKCGNQYAIMSRKCLYDALDALDKQAMADISQELRNNYLIADGLQRFRRELYKL